MNTETPLNEKDTINSPKVFRSRWFQSLGLDKETSKKYSEQFKNHDIKPEQIQNLDSGILKELGTISIIISISFTDKYPTSERNFEPRNLSNWSST